MAKSSCRASGLLTIALAIWSLPWMTTLLKPGGRNGSGSTLWYAMITASMLRGEGGRVGDNGRGCWDWLSRLSPNLKMGCSRDFVGTVPGDASVSIIILLCSHISANEANCSGLLELGPVIIGCFILNQNFTCLSPQSFWKQSVGGFPGVKPDLLTCERQNCCSNTVSWMPSLDASGTY